MRFDLLHGKRIVPFLLFSLTLILMNVADGAVSKTMNFVVTAPNPHLASVFAQRAEELRRELAVSWLGQTLPDWSEPCKISVMVAPNLSPGGETSFMFNNGHVFNWVMSVQGSKERILDSVLPHEITHMIFACKFRCPVRRWADEGAATSVEDISERTKYRAMLVEFLQTNRGIPFRTMVSLKEYPQDAMPFYAQSYTAAEYLIARGGRIRYVNFVEEGIQTDDWGQALKNHYGYENLGQFQNTWVAWVGKGFPQVEDDLLQRDYQLAMAGRTNTNGSNLRRNASYTAAPMVSHNPLPEPNLLIRTPVSTAHSGNSQYISNGSQYATNGSQYATNGSQYATNGSQYNTNDSNIRQASWQPAGNSQNAQHRGYQNRSEGVVPAAFEQIEYRQPAQNYSSQGAIPRNSSAPAAPRGYYNQGGNRTAGGNQSYNSVYETSRNGYVPLR